MCAVPQAVNFATPDWFEFGGITNQRYRRERLLVPRVPAFRRPICSVHGARARTHRMVCVHAEQVPDASHEFR